MVDTPSTTRTNGNGNQPLSQAPRAEGPPPVAAPLNYRAEFLVETAEGYHVLITGEQLTPQDCMVWLKRTSQQLKGQGFLPVRRDLVVNLPAPVASPAASGGGGSSGGAAYAIAGEGGRPPKCSEHGPMKFVEGVYKPDHQRAGQKFEFWGCTNRQCRVRANPDGSVK